MEYRITLAIDHYYYIELQVFGGKLVKMHEFTHCRVPFLSFRTFLCPFYLEYHRTAVSEVSKGKCKA